jgi:ribonuclease R
MNEAELERAILELLATAGYQPVKSRVIAQRLGVPRAQAPEVKREIKRLASQGRLAYGSSRTVEPVSPASPRSNRVVGVFRRMENGYGFVRPTGTTTATDPRLADVYIPAEKSGDASSGDVVMVRIDRRGGRHPGPRGEIVEVIERESHDFVGTYFESAGSGYVEVDGTLFSRPIFVGDPGARGARPDDKVVIEMVRFPSHFREGEGVITEVLGPRGKAGVDTLSIIREFKLPDRFAGDALEDARRQADQFDEKSLADRLDATKLVIVTIDPADARDFDDAISLERLPNGHWRLGVHIADVAHFVPPGTALDREAYQRATSVYLPDRVIPMLPELISNGLASLQPGKVRYTKTVFMEFTAEGLRVASEAHRAAIKSRRRLNYEQVDEFLHDPEPWRRKLGAKVHELLGRMHQLAMVLRRRRIERGALELAMTEVKVDLDRHGRVAGAHVVESTASHQIIEEFMVAANEAVAEMLAARDLHFLRRVHAPPVPKKLKDLGEFVAELGFKVDSLQSRFELQKLLAEVAGRPEQHAVNYAVLRSLQRAVYSPAPEGHYALASGCYCHFTSPIRRYPDLTVHRLLDAILTGQSPRNDLAELVAVGEHCSEREQRAEAAERELTKVKLLAYLRDRVGEEMDAVVTGVESFGLFAEGIELPAEGLIHLSSLADDRYRFDRTTHTLAGHRAGNTFRLGDRVRVAVLRVDLDRREIDFRLVRRYERPEAPPKARRGRKRSAAESRKPGPSSKKRKKKAPRKTIKRGRRRR